ncbi:OmpW family outer membrane protein [Aeromonas sp. 164P]
MAGQVGMDMAINDRWFVNASAWIMDIDTDVTCKCRGYHQNQDRPMAFMVGVGYRF